ncbi:MAG: (2Fe-2S)-binding protein [Spirochaetota bacterium]|nr:MAG: (2Fe-2S)-binding protein [Spirochaetota bacterium]
MIDDEELVICRCEEVTKGEILEVMEKGAETLNEVKRLTRAGMGLCQGRVCRRLVMQIYCQNVGKKPEEIKPTKYRPPVRPLPIETLASGVKSIELDPDYEGI